VDIGGGFIVEFFLYVIAFIVISMGVVLLITAWLSDDKEQSILKQMWHTYFASDEAPSDDKHEQP
jgi:hypothetical protein